jgi:NIPSNAP
MPMLYELAQLTLQIGATPKAVAGVKAYVADSAAKGTLLGCWSSEIGELNKVAVLRGFTEAAELRDERKRALEGGDPFGCREVLTHLEMDSYAPFPGIAPVKPGALGPIYEIRSYALKPGGLPGTIAAWHAALPARNALSVNLVVMHTLDGPPRFTHIWPYASLEQRAAIRAKSVATGIWPPSGGGANIAVMKNGIWLPTEISPLT